ncbi:MAG: HAD family hydrolase [Alicyclobacillus sp.]|nr:HAD family hydrolase [Alicyclobacillus sp.]
MHTPTHPAYPVDRLRDVQLVIFDLDGTVYQETAHFEAYGRRLAERLPAPVRSTFLREVEEALAGEHPLRYGDAYDVTQRAIVRDGLVLDWAGQRTPLQPSDRLEFVDDPWGIYGNLARYHGISESDLQAAFLETRAYMQSPTFKMTGLPGLREAINRLRSRGLRFALATNSPEPDSRAILEKLGLAGAFDAEIFNASKQTRAKEHFQSLHHSFGVPFEKMASVGDHYRNEIRPAVELGMRTVCIDRYHRPNRPDVDVVVHHPAELGQVFGALADLLDGRADG